MNLMITLIFENSFHEHYLPNVNNKAVPISISSEVSGYSKELKLSLEVWNNEWFLLENEQLTIADKEGRLKSVQIVPDLVLQCTLRDKAEVFSIFSRLRHPLTPYRPTLGTAAPQTPAQPRCEGRCRP